MIRLCGKVEWLPSASVKIAWSAPTADVDLRNGPVADGYLAVALLLGAFGELHFALYPGIATGLVTTAGALRLAFFGVLLLGINAESRSDLRALRSAYAGLERLRR